MSETIDLRPVKKFVSQQVILSSLSVVLATAGFTAAIQWMRRPIASAAIVHVAEAARDVTPQVNPAPAPAEPLPHPPSALSSPTSQHAPASHEPAGQAARSSAAPKPVPKPASTPIVAHTTTKPSRAPAPVLRPAHRDPVPRQVEVIPAIPVAVEKAAPGADALSPQVIVIPPAPGAVPKAAAARPNKPVDIAPPEKLGVREVRADHVVLTNGARVRVGARLPNGEVLMGTDVARGMAETDRRFLMISQ